MTENGSSGTPVFPNPAPLWTKDFTIITLGSVVSLLGNAVSGFAIGLLVQAVQPLFARIEMGVLFGNFAGGFITAVLAQLLAALFAYGDVNAAIVGGIMPLLSGLLMTTAMRDTMYGDLISGVTRAVEALLLAGAVALGVYVGLTVVSMMGGVLL